MVAGLSIEQEGLQSLNRALKAESDGKALRRDLSKNLRAVLDPIKDQARSNLLGVASAGLSRGQPLRQTVLNQMKAEARFSGRSTGARLRVKRKGMPRGFRNAPKALNNPKGWRHPVFGDQNTWTQQYAVPPEWFDRAAREGHPDAQEAALEAMEDMAARIVANAK